MTITGICRKRRAAEHSSNRRHMSATLKGRYQIMPRPKKWRKVCSLPESSRFGPLDVPAGCENAVNMAVDEFETIRLIDLEGLTQEECAAQMDIARTTVQGIYNEARRKIAESIVNGKVLIIGGGEYRLCDNGCGSCGGHGRKRGCHGFTDGGS